MWKPSLGNFACLVALGVTGCSSGAIGQSTDEPSGETVGPAPGSGPTPNGSSSSSPGTASPGGPSPGQPAPNGPNQPAEPGSTAPPGVDPAAPNAPTPTDPANPNPAGPAPEGQVSSFAPRIRRLTNAEFEATVQTLLSTTESTVAAFVPDARQSGFTRNADQIVDPLFARQLRDAAATLAEGYVTGQLTAALPCASAGDEACARSFFEQFLPKAFRRGVQAEEVEAVLGVYRVGAQSGFPSGMSLALSAVLQSAAFLYHTELGDSTAGQATQLTPHEVAAALAYLFTGKPPDAELSGAAGDATLLTSEAREAHARRLLQTAEARSQVVELIVQWLGVDVLTEIAKDNAAFGNYEALRPHMLAETRDFVVEAVFNDGGSLQTLLGADYTVADAEMLSFYGLQGSPGRVSLAGSGRRGVLTHASFLARYAKEAESNPIARGVTIGRRVMCVPLPDPVGLENALVPPPPDPNMTTRERFDQHVADAACAACHAGIDAVGFAFENFDAIGGKREVDNGKPVDTQTELPELWSLDFATSQLADSTDLASSLSQSEDVKRCFARHLAQFSGAATNPNVEDSFLATWQQMSDAGRDNIIEVLVAYAASDLFVQRAGGQ